MLDDTAARLVASVDGSAQSATLIATVADLYIRLEDPLGAESLLDKALAVGIGAKDAVALAQLQLRAATVKASLGKLEAARTLLPVAARVFDAAPQRFRTERLQIVAARALLARHDGDRDGAIALLLGNEAAANASYADDHRELLTYYNNLLVYLAEANRTDAMPAVLGRAEAAIARTGEAQGVEALGILQIKGVYLSKRDDVAGAEAVFRQVVELRRQKFGPSAGLAVDLLQLGRAQLTLGQTRAAIASLAEAQALATAHLGAAAVPTLVAGMSLAEARAENGEPAAAVQLLAQVEPAVAATGRAGPYWGIYLRTRAVTRLWTGDKRGAGADVDAAAAIFKTIGPAGAPYLKSLDKLRVRLAP
jgi:non-specific serine/threonine protein kinase/serine/threonine-protein kinase